MITSMNLAAGLSGVQEALMNDWIGPAFFIAIMIFGLMLLKDRSFRNILMLVLVAVVAGVLIFGGQQLFGSDGNLTKAGTNISKKVN